MTTTHPPPDNHHTPDHTDPLTLTEQALLGACLTDPRAIDDTADTGLLPTHCYQARHELILAATYAVHATGTRPDPITVADHLTTTGDLTRAGGLTYLHQLTLDVAATTNAAWYATKIRHAHTHRTIRAAGTTLATTPDHDDPLDTLEHARATLDALAIEDDTTPTHETAIYDAIAALDEPPGTPTPWAPLTRLIAGWKPGELYIIGARPGIGKTVIGGAILLDAARRHQPTTYISLEMTRTELYHRLLANTGDVDMGRIQHRNLTDTDHHHLATAAADLARLPYTSTTGQPSPSPKSAPPSAPAPAATTHPSAPSSSTTSASSPHPPAHPATTAASKSTRSPADSRTSPKTSTSPSSHSPSSTEHPNSAPTKPQPCPTSAKPAAKNKTPTS